MQGVQRPQPVGLDQRAERRQRLVRLAAAELDAASAQVPHPFRTAAQLLAHCERTGLPISGVMLANERTWRDEDEIRQQLLHIWTVMEECKDSSLRRTGPLPGGLNVARRAPEWHRRLRTEDPDRDPGFWPEWVNLVALAVNEENASGGRVVTAPTNGSLTPTAVRVTLPVFSSRKV